MENLPTEVMVDILSRLPVKTIIHCKCVCKKWQNIVFDSYFINFHLSRSSAGLMVQYDVDTPGGAILGILKWVKIKDELDHHRLHHDPFFDFDLNRYLVAPIPYTQMFPVGSVNGLICIWQRGVNVDNIYTCNPTTRECLILPRPRCYRDGKGAIVDGFGVGSVTGEYKVLRTFQRDLSPYPYISSRHTLLEAEVYSLGTGQWRSLGQVPYQFNGFNGPFLNGRFHWITCDADSPENLFTFDLDTETFRLFPGPPTESEDIQISWFHFQSLAVLKGCLCISDTYDSQFTMWVMKEYGIKKSWHKEVVITQAICPDVGWPMTGPMYLVHVLKDLSILMIYGSKLLVYCPLSKTMEDLEIPGSWLIMLPHRPSFLKLRDFESERVHMF